MKTDSCCHTSGAGPRWKRVDWIFWICAPVIVAAYAASFFLPATGDALEIFVHSVHEFASTMWWGVLMGIASLALLSKVPREFIMALLGKSGLGGIARATFAGVLLDMCNHGILMIGSKLYERGATTGQVMAFLIASPWNSLSITFILIALIGLKWTLVFFALSVVVAMVTGLIFEALVARGVLPSNPARTEIPADFRFWAEAKSRLSNVKWTPALVGEMLLSGARESKMVLRWLFFGIVLASALRVFLDPADFQQFFGPTILGLTATVFFATVLEVCSEGSSPIAADILNRGGAPGNAFAFLMAGVSTDYTEVMVLRDVTKSWKIALFLPLITLPQIVLLAWLINMSL